MRFFPLAAVAAVAAGVTLLGASLGGMSHVDAELARATQPAPVVQLDQVVYRDDDAAPGDCPRDMRQRGVRHHSRPEL